MSSPTKAPVERRHREAAATLIPFVASAWVDDPTHTYGLATPELSVLTKAAAMLAEAEQAGYARGLADGAERERAAVKTWLVGYPEYDDESCRTCYRDTAPAPAVEAWVSCEERMPEHGTLVLFWCHTWLQDATPGVGRFGFDDTDCDVWLDETQPQGEDELARKYRTKDVRCWKPFIPPPPKESR